VISARLDECRHIVRRVAVPIVTFGKEFLRQGSEVSGKA
jgi:hypothetical protein